MSRAVFHARLRLFPTAEGGRSHRMDSGYRSLLRVHGTETDFGFELRLDHPDVGIYPGGVGEGTVIMWADPELYTFELGQTFEIREGSRVVGEGEVDRLLR